MPAAGLAQPVCCWQRHQLRSITTQAVVGWQAVVAWHALAADHNKIAALTEKKFERFA